MLSRPKLQQLQLLFPRTWQRIAVGTATSATARGVSMMVSFATVPLAQDYLGAERYGLWMTATSFVAMLTSFADGGVSVAMITATAKAYAKGGDAEVRRIIGSALAVLVPIALLI